MTAPYVLILAGQREGVVDPLCDYVGVTHKADVPILGRKMLSYVIDALNKCAVKTPFYISGYGAGENAKLVLTKSGSGPADSVSMALEHDVGFPCIVTTCDHALLTAQMVDFFIKAAQESGSDFCVGLASKDVIFAKYPETRRTYLKFSDVSVSGCNMFYVANDKGRAAIEFWKDAQHLRKQPLKLARKIGLGIGLRYALGGLTLPAAFDYAGRKIGIKASPVLIPIAEAAIDVDKPDDLQLVEKILKTR